MFSFVNTSEPIITQPQNSKPQEQSQESTVNTDIETKLEPEASNTQEPLADATPTQQAEKPSQAEVVRELGAEEKSALPLLTEINLQLTENCWIKLEDATGKVLILGEKKAGYNKTVAGEPPFKAVFGAPQAVKLSLGNEVVDLSHLPKSRVARLTLPLED